MKDVKEEFISIQDSPVIMIQRKEMIILERINKKKCGTQVFHTEFRFRENRL